MTRLLLVGRNGQVGWEVFRRMSQAGLAFNALNRSQLDITQRPAVLRNIERLSPSIVVNAAAYTAVDKAESEPDIAFAVNRDGAAHLAEACASVNAVLLHFSTDYVFDGAKGAPYTENDQPAPLGVYGESKLAGEEAVRAACTRHVILRTSWIYGSHGQNFLKTMLHLGRERDVLRIVDDQFGNPTFAGDIANVISKLVAALRVGPWPQHGFGTFHCASQGTMTWCDFAREIFERAGPVLGRKPKIEAIRTVDYPTPAKRPFYSALDCGRLASVHGIVMPTWTSGLIETLDVLLAPPAVGVMR